ncbi:TetR/AcrR family transcriptional regulator [Metabacillus herbersteinensis]|uniref:TetR/AcrR family transcriptional regulator n=1 Tax=Metabacillus herbersteinensis TaxID=283816 RepID=A0ABV6GB16_9BACI
MTANLIKKAAKRHFAREGYDGASLAAIASEVGIKKQSIYSHFSNKDHLFLTITEEIFSDEVNTIKIFFEENSGGSVKSTLYLFLTNYGERYESDEQTNFMLRNAFFPPKHLEDHVMQKLYGYYDQLEALLMEVLQDEKLVVSSTEAAIAFLGLFDAVIIEMLYGGKNRFNRRLEASWNIYWRGITKKAQAPCSEEERLSSQRPVATPFSPSS